MLAFNRVLYCRTLCSIFIVLHLLYFVSSATITITSHLFILFLIIFIVFFNIFLLQFTTLHFLWLEYHKFTYNQGLKNWLTLIWIHQSGLGSANLDRDWSYWLNGAKGKDLLAYYSPSLDEKKEKQEEKKNDSLGMCKENLVLPFPPWYESPIQISNSCWY